ncbi:MAG: rRNA maturation RNase YbeY [Planctomycetes bacterium]|nr:rRNA maturation RNase YbeY [Planctomycetota bacterium]
MTADYDIQIHNGQTAYDIDPSALERIAQRTLEAECIASAEISVAVVDDAAIHELNRRWLDHDEPTDVLSFLLDERVDDGGRRIEGEVVLSAETAHRRAPEFGWDHGDELALYLVHGLLHLAGYDDLEPEARLEMRHREREILSLCGVKLPAERAAPTRRFIR